MEEAGQEATPEKRWEGIWGKGWSEGLEAGRGGSYSIAATTAGQRDSAGGTDAGRTAVSHEGPGPTSDLPLRRPSGVSKATPFLPRTSWV